MRYFHGRSIYLYSNAKKKSNNRFNDHSVFKNTDTMKLSLFSSLESNVLKKVLCKW